MEEKTKLETANRWIRISIQIIILITLAFKVMGKEYGDVGILAITFLLTCYPFMVKKWLHIALSARIQICITLFIFGAQYLGTVMDLYGKFFWWDTVLHTLSGALFFYLGVVVMKQINQKTTKANLSIWIIIVFGIFFSLGIGAIWEIFEFVADSLGANMQRAIGEMGRGAIMDTMIDLISATTGTGVMAIIYYFSRKKKEIKERTNS